VADYTTVPTLKAYLGHIVGVADDAELARCISTASSEIDHICSRTFEPLNDPAVARFFEPWFDRDAYRWIVPVDDIFDTDDLAVHLWNGTDDYDVPVTGWTLSRPGVLVLPATNDYTPGGVYDEATAVKVTAKFGYASVPEPVEQACLIIAARIFARRESRFGVVNSLDGSEISRLTRVMDPDAVNALAGYIKYWAVR
jgi:hypothetical protein